MDIQRIEQYVRIAAVALLALGCVLVLKPFLGAILFAAVLCMSTWAAYAWLRDRWGGRRSLAALAVGMGRLGWFWMAPAAHGQTEILPDEVLTACCQIRSSSSPSTRRTGIWLKTFERG